MPRFEPFLGLRYDLSRVDPRDVTAPPYDVLSPAERAALVARSDRNVVLIDLPVEEDGDGRYHACGDLLQDWLDDGTLIVDEQPSFTVYRMAYTDDLGRPAHTVGVIGALTLATPGEGEILPHEETTKKAKSDRLDLLRGTSANLSPIWSLSLTKGLTDLLPTDGTPLAQWADDDGVEHTVWRVDDAQEVRAISDAVGASPVVIADGHHRYETSLAYRDERRADDGEGGAADATMMLVVELVDDELTVRPIHRLVGGLPAGTDLAAALEDRGFSPAGSATVAEVADGSVLAAMADADAIAVVNADGSATLLHPDPATFAGVADLDSARVAQALAGLPAHEVVYQHGTDLVQAAVVSGDADAGILLRPATVAQIAANAHTGERMPAKTTFFHPKPKTGIVLRPMPRPAA